MIGDMFFLFWVSGVIRRGVFLGIIGRFFLVMGFFYFRSYCIEWNKGCIIRILIFIGSGWEDGKERDGRGEIFFVWGNVSLTGRRRI